MIKLKQLLTEKTVRLSTMKDANFEPGQFVQLMGKKGMVKLDKKSVHSLAKIIRQLSGKKGMGWSFTQHEGINEDENPCWKGYEQIGMKKKGGKQVPNCVPIAEEYDVVNEQDYNYFITYLKEYQDDSLEEAEYQGRKVKLGKPTQGDAKKFKVYVKNPKGNVVKVNFGQGGDAKGGTMRIRKDNPKARKSFRARHNCDNPGPRHKARYWSCRKW